MGHIDRVQGRWNESAHNYEEALELDPRNLFTLRQLALGYQYMRRFAESAATLDSAVARGPPRYSNASNSSLGSTSIGGRIPSLCAKSSKPSSIKIQRSR